MFRYLSRVSTIGRRCTFGRALRPLVPCFGVGVDAALLARWAAAAETAGWDGFFLWDHLFPFTPGPIDVVDPWITLTAAAVGTTTIRLGTLVTPLPRRRPMVVARQTATLDRLSGGRLILGVGTGAGPYEWEYCGEQSDPRIRGDMLDEHLGLLDRLWSGAPVHHDGTHYRLAGPEWSAICTRRRCSNHGSRSGSPAPGPEHARSPGRPDGTGWSRCARTGTGTCRTQPRSPTDYAA